MIYSVCGTLTASRDLKKEECAMVYGMLHDDPMASVSVHGRCIDIDGYRGTGFEATLDDIIGELWANGVSLEGEIHFIGDDEAFYVLSGSNGYEIYHMEDAWKIHASDGEIAEVLEKRGYHVTKKDKKYAMLVTEEDQRYPDEKQLSFFANAPWEGLYHGFATGDTPEELMSGGDSEGFFYQLYDAKSGSRIGSGALSIDALTDEIKEYEAGE